MKKGEGYVEDTWKYFQGEDGAGYIVNAFRSEEDDKLEVNLYTVPKDKANYSRWHDDMIEIRRCEC